MPLESARSSSAVDVASTRPKSYVPPRSVRTSSGRSRQRSRWYRASAGDQGPYDASSFQLQLSSRQAFGLRQRPCPRQAPMCVRGAGDAATPATPAVPGNRSRFGDDSDFTVWWGVWNLYQNALFSQSSSGPAGGTSDGYGLGRGAEGPDRQCTTSTAGAIRVIV